MPVHHLVRIAIIWDNWNIGSIFDKWTERGVAMATTIQQAFAQFSSNLEITDYQTGLVSDRRRHVVEVLANEISLYPSSPSILIGSYDRRTLIRYLKEGDVDVMVILNYGANQGWDNPDGTIRALDKFKAVLDKAYPYTEKGRDRNCITMKFTEFRLDIVPAFAYDTGYYTIPDSIRRTWVQTDPIAFAQSITDVNKKLNNNFVPLIKMIKAWNRNEGWPIRSFHLECMMHNYFRNNTTCYTSPFMIKQFCAALPGYLTQAAYDPVRGDRVDTYLDNYANPSKRQIAIEKANKAVLRSNDAYNDQEKYPSIAINKWKALMGEFFPTYG